MWFGTWVRGRERIPSDAGSSLLPYKLYFLSSLKYHFLSLFSIFFTFNSLFRLHWLLCCFFSIFMGTVPIYTTTQSMLFSLFTFIFTNYFVCYKHSFIQHISHYLLAMFSWTQSHQGVFVYALWQRTLPFWIKFSLPQNHHLSLSQKWQKLPLIPYLHFLACIRWFPPTFLTIFGNDIFLARQIPKSGLGRIPTIGLPPLPHQITPFASCQPWALLPYMAEM